MTYSLLLFAANFDLYGRWRRKQNLKITEIAKFQRRKWNVVVHLELLHSTKWRLQPRSLVSPSFGAAKPDGWWLRERRRGEGEGGLWRDKQDRYADDTCPSGQSLLSAWGRTQWAAGWTFTCGYSQLACRSTRDLWSKIPVKMTAFRKLAIFSFDSLSRLFFPQCSGGLYMYIYVLTKRCDKFFTHPPKHKSTEGHTDNVSRSSIRSVVQGRGKKTRYVEAREQN